MNNKTTEQNKLGKALKVSYSVMLSAILLLFAFGYFSDTAPYSVWEDMAKFSFYISLILLGCCLFYCLVIWLKTKKTTHRTNTNIVSSTSNANNELRFRCNVCGQIFCYTQEEYDKNEGLKKAALIGDFSTGLMRGLGSSYHANESQKQTNRDKDRIKDYSKCPNCNSSDIAQITEHTPSFESKKEDDSISILEKLAKLHDQGIITDEEFQQKKSEILAKM